MRRIHEHCRWLALALPTALTIGACTDTALNAVDPEPPDATTTGEPGDTEIPPPPEGDTDPTAGSSDSTGVIFIEIPDGGPPPGCDVWAQDCPSGEKCMPWANDGGNVWNALKCVEIVDDPGVPGDTCEVMGSGVSGNDTCDLGGMCWGVDPETNEGVCVQMCLGEQQAPLCDEPEHSCVIVNEGVLTICLPQCDPLLQTCAANEGCYPVNGEFICAPDASGPQLGTYGDPCEAINMCDAGLFCAAAAGVPNCQGSLGCCSDFCDLDSANPDADCNGAGQQCLPWYEDGEGGPSTEFIGACVLPT